MGNIFCDVVVPVFKPLGELAVLSLFCEGVVLCVYFLVLTGDVGFPVRPFSGRASKRWRWWVRCGSCLLNMGIDKLALCVASCVSRSDEEGVD